jgi:predicted GIY-YIG superfamily endonuclease
MAQSYIYAIGPEAGPLKIGYTADPASRLGNLQVGHSEKLIIHYLREMDSARVWAMEQLIHRGIRYKKIRGEWFDISPADAKLEIDDAFMKWEDEADLNRRFKGRTIL